MGVLVYGCKDQHPYTHTALLRINLGALEFAAEVDVEAFPFGEDVEDVAAFPVAVSGLADSAEREVDFGADGGCVDVDDSGFDVSHGAEGAVYVRGINRAAEPVLHSVDHL